MSFQSFHSIKSQKNFGDSKMKIIIKLTSIKRQKIRRSKIALVKGWLKYLTEQFIKSFWEVFFEKYSK
jgi:hypothetical protein